MQYSILSASIERSAGSALANERVQTTAAGQVVVKRTTPWRDGTPLLVILPLEFMQRLAAPTPRPRLHLIRLCPRNFAS